MDYTKKLTDPRWQRKRLEKMQAVGWRCEICRDDKEELHVHHSFYKQAEPWEYPNEDLQCVCSTCHRLAHTDPAKIIAFCLANGLAPSGVKAHATLSRLIIDEEWLTLHLEIVRLGIELRSGKSSRDGILAQGQGLMNQREERAKLVLGKDYSI